MKNKMPMKIILPFLNAAVLILAALPNALVMHFAGPEDAFEQYYPYYSLMPVGYGNWSPVITLALTAVLFYMSAAALIGKKHSLYPKMRLVGIVASIASVLSVIFNEMTVISWIIFALLVLETILTYLLSKQES